LFGGFELRAAPAESRIASLGKRERVLLAYLALTPKNRQHRRRLATLLWGDANDETALDNLRTCLWSLRKALGDTDHRIISSDGEAITLDVAMLEIDAVTFRRLASHSGLGELEAAARLYGGGLLDGLSIDSEEFEAWRRSEATMYQGLAVDVLTRLMTQCAQAGEADRAIDAGMRLLRIEPLHEPAVRQLMRLHNDSGRRGVAAQLYRELADGLRKELQAQPAPATRRLFQEVSVAGDEPVPRPAAAVPSREDRPIALAVLPFSNMSGDPSQEFFSDGMTEEITSALAKEQKWQVIARTSAFQFKGRNQDARTVGQTLGVSHLIEGSVRKSGDHVRISAQLIHAKDGVQLWSQTYHRQFTDIFAIQEDIAQAIAAALLGPLGLVTTAQMVPNRTEDLESYQKYLVARGLYRARGAGVAQAISILEPLVARDPGYAPAWALLARSHALAPLYNPVLYSGSVEDAQRLWQASVSKMESAARRAIQLDSRRADGYGALASIMTMKGSWIEAEDLFVRALGIDANDPETLHNHSVMLGLIGKSMAALALRERLQKMEPLVSVYNIYTAFFLWATGRKAEAIAMVEALPPASFGGFYRNVVLAEGYAAKGRYAEAAEALLLITGNQVSRQSVEEAVRLLRIAPAKLDPASLPHLEGELGFVYAHVGAVERVMEFSERNLRIGWIGSNANFPLWTQEHEALRKTERFKNYVRAAGMVDYWRARGWADVWAAAEGGYPNFT
jgi:TolB-like protein/Tfp pilus assembly protein PilF